MLEYLVLIPPLGNNNKKVTWYIDAVLCPPIKKILDLKQISLVLHKNFYLIVLQINKHIFSLKVFHEQFNQIYF